MSGPVARLRRRPGALRRVFAPLLAAVAALALAAAAPATAASAQPAPPAQAAQGTASGGIDRFVSCLNSGRAGDVLLLFDESQSLRKSDPTVSGRAPARVEAAQFLLRRLARTTDSVQLDIALSGFGREYHPYTGWTPLTQDSAGLQAEAAAFADRTDEIDTNYYLALVKAREQLDDKKRAPGGEQRCQALVWFSDGELDFQVRDRIDLRQRFGPDATLDAPADITTQAGVEDARTKAADLICQPGSGVADNLRGGDVTTIGIGLTGPETTPTTFDLMRSIATGTSDGRTCGDDRDPIPGSFETASNVDELLFAFDRIDPTGSVDNSEKGICQQPLQNALQCPLDERHRFFLDSSVDRVSILGRTDIPGIEALLVPPPGSRAVGLNRKPTALGGIDGVDARYTWETDRTISVDLAATGGSGWDGEWSIIFLDPQQKTGDQKSRTNIHIEGNLRPELYNRDTVKLPSNGTAEFQIGLVRTTGARVAAATEVPGQATLSAELVASDGRRVPIMTGVPKDQIGPRSVPLTDVTPGTATLALTLDVTTARPDGSPGTTLAPQRVEVPLTVLPPFGYPTIAGPVDFGVGDRTTTLQKQVDVTGPGCVWVDARPALTTTPQGAGLVDVTAENAATGEQATSAQTCLVVPEGRTDKLTFTLTTETPGNGAVSGTIPVRTAPLDARDQVQTVPLQFGADLRRPLDVYRFTAALIAALLASLLPVLLLYLIKWFTARIPPGNGLHAVSVPIRIVGGRVTRDGEAFALHPGELRDLVPIAGRGARDVTVAGGVTLRTRIGWSPFGAPFVTARGPEWTVAASSADPGTHGRRPDARLPLGVHNHWVVVHGPAGPADRADVLLLVGADNVGSAPVLVQDVNRRAPGMLAQLRERGGHTADPGPGDGPPQPGVPASQAGRGPSGAPAPPGPPVPPGPPQSWPPTTPPAGGPPTAPYPYPRGG